MRATVPRGRYGGSCEALAEACRRSGFAGSNRRRRGETGSGEILRRFHGEKLRADLRERRTGVYGNSPCGGRSINMCGICGVFDSRPEAVVHRHTLKAMADTITHRGPDDEGFFNSGGVGLAHRRLSIIDLSGGHQPLANEDGSVWIAFNGEIYNFEELNRKFLASGHVFKTRSDTETIIHLYEELGENCFAELRGMFAIALWDARRKRLVLARDRLGKKPLFYAWDGKRLVFGSEIKAMWPAGNIPKDIDVEALSDYFSLQYVPAPKTIYRSVRKLRPAHYLIA